VAKQCRLQKQFSTNPEKPEFHLFFTFLFSTSIMGEFPLGSSSFEKQVKRQHLGKEYISPFC
jgi:hypothetical protein